MRQSRHFRASAPRGQLERHGRWSSDTERAGAVGPPWKVGEGSGAPVAPLLLRRVTLHARRRRYHDGGVECSCRIEESRIMPIPAAARPLTVWSTHSAQPPARAGRSTGRAVLCYLVALPRQLRAGAGLPECLSARYSDSPRLPPSRGARSSAYPTLRLQAQSTRALGPLSPAIGMGRCRSGCSCESLQSRRRRTSATSAAWRWSAARGSGARSATSFCA